MKKIRFLLLSYLLLIFVACDDGAGLNTSLHFDDNTAVTEITLNQSKVTLVVGESTELTATVSPDDATNQNVFWESADTAIANVDQEGGVTTRLNGETVITATAAGGDVTATCQVIVVPIDTTAPDSVTLTMIKSSPTTIEVGWDDPDDSDLSYIAVSCSGTTVNISPGAKGHTFSGLSPETRYSISLVSVDTSNLSSAVENFDLTTESLSSPTVSWNLIQNYEECRNVSSDLAGRYILTKDLDFSGIVWSPLGTSFSNAFSGFFDGGGHTLKLLTISSAMDNQGFFGTILNGTVQYLTLADVRITSLGSAIGSIAGQTSGAKIIHCSSSGVVIGAKNVGGLLGANSDASIIQYCSSSCNVGGEINLGGFVGSNEATIKDSYSSGSVSSSISVSTQTDGSNICLGGFVGSTNDGIVENCYSSGGGSVEIEMNQNKTFYCYLGGFVGNGYNISNCYASGAVKFIATGTYSTNPEAYCGGFSGKCSGDITNCYAVGRVILIGGGTTAKGGVVGTGYSSFVHNCVFDNQTTGYESGWTDLGIGLTTLQMKNKDSFIALGWDFYGETGNGTSEIWSIESLINDGYPYLRGLTGQE